MALSIRKHLSRRKGVILAALFVTFCGVAVGVLVHPSVNAAGAELFTDRQPNPDDMIAGGVGGAVDLHLKKQQGIAYVLKNKIAAYYPKNEDGRSPRGKSIKILEGKEGRVCDVANYINGELHIKITIDGGEKVYDIPMQKVCRGNGANFYGKSFAFPTSGQLIKHDSGLYEAQINIYYGDNVTAGRNKSENDLNYDVQLLGGSSKRVLALRGNTDPQEWGFRSAWFGRDNLAGNQKVKAEVPFGYPCSETETSIDDEHRTLELYDADAVFGDTYMWVTKKGNKLEKNDYVDPRDHPNWLIERWDTDMKAWKLKNSNLSHNTIRIKQMRDDGTELVKPGVEYRLVVYNDGQNRTYSPHSNTLSLSIPHDSIYATPTCDYKLKPSVKIMPPIEANQELSAGTQVPAQGHVEVTDGYDNDKHDWYLTAHVFDHAPSNRSEDDDSTRGPCEWRPGIRCEKMDKGTKKFKNDDFDTDIKQFDTTGLDAGDFVCFVMSVLKPTYASDATHWYHSAMKCVSISANVDSTTVTPATYSYYPDLAVKAKIMNDGGYPLVDKFKSKDYKRKYEWKILEAKFKSLPSSIGIADKGDCTKVQALANYLHNTCREIPGGDDLFPNPTPVESVTKTAASQQEGPDPIGTWTCYTTSYRKNPEPLETLHPDINWWERDWNDTNSTSENPSRWGDGYYEYWVPPVYDADGHYVSGGYMQPVGSKVDGNAEWLSHYNRSPYPDPPQYKFTPYKRSSCSISGIDPKLQVRGHDLQVGGDIDSWIRTLTKGNAVGSYGGTTEYGALSGGKNSRIASGSGLIRRSASNDQSNWSPLTFTNNDPSKFGYFSGVLQANRPSASEAEEITSASQISLAPGTKKIYHVSGKLTIDSDLKYPTGYGLISDIPRIIIIADTIEIGPNVTQIDPWLVADNISTCSSVTTNYNSSPAAALGSADLTIDKCSNPLIFNGPVYVSNLYLYRTGGSRIPRSDIDAVAASWGFNPDAGIDPNTYCESNNCGADEDGRRYAFSAPAEVFNLRPDVYLSSLSGLKTNKPAAITDKITELPPRF